MPASKTHRRRHKSLPIHDSIKLRLGYDVEQSDAEIVRDWKSRLRRVCKPCWELRYCPYGPLVEQSPLLPPARAEMIEHNEYFKTCLRDNQLGSIEELSDERRKLYEEWLNDEEILTWQAHHELMQEQREAHIAASENPAAEFNRMFHGELPPIEQYRVRYDLPERFSWDGISQQQKRLLRERIRERKKFLKGVLKAGFEDARKPLDEGRRAWFEKSVSDFDPEDYPDSVPEIFVDGECNIFGHICPVFFAAEAMTETSTERRRGRYIPFVTKMRVVRRDNHTCQHCGKHLADTEVEFDHKIPLSKGGSTEEHNIRLTCFDCNRDKSDTVDI